LPIRTDGIDVCEEAAAAEGRARFTSGGSSLSSGTLLGAARKRLLALTGQLGRPTSGKTMKADIAEITGPRPNPGVASLQDY
jgi:hypothetical protein